MRTRPSTAKYFGGSRLAGLAHDFSEFVFEQFMRLKEACEV
jgi:hypothetical protein